MFLCGLYRFARHLRRRLRERAKNSAGVKPARALCSENPFPVNVAGLQLRNRRMPTIRTTQSSANPKASLGEIQPVTHTTAHAVILDPFEMRLIDSALINQILNQTADGIVCQRGNDRGIHSETTPQSARDVVFATAFPNLKSARGVNAAIAWIEPEHHFAQADQIPTAL